MQKIELKFDQPEEIIDFVRIMNRYECDADFTVENHVLKITQNVVIRPTTYTIGITDEYRRILVDARTLKEFKETFDRN